MPTGLEIRCTMAGSATVLFGDLWLLVKSKSPHAIWEDVPSGDIAFLMAQPARPVQSEGCSAPSREIDSRLESAIAEIRDAESEPPWQIRVTSPRQIGAAQMDPWVAKNERRLRLIEKKH